MRTFTAVIPKSAQLPLELALLLAPVRLAEPSAPDEHVGHSEGVLVDDNGHVVAFIVRLSPKLVPSRPRTLVSASAITISGDLVLHLSWTESQLLAQPRLDSTLQPHNRVDGGPPVESKWMPARPNMVPAEGGLNGPEALKEGFEGGVIGGAIGAAAGLLIGGPIAGAALAIFFAAGGSLAGLISGATHETAVEAGEMKFNNIAPEHHETGKAALRLLEEKIRDPAMHLAGLLEVTRFTPMTTTGEPSNDERSASDKAAE